MRPNILSLLCYEVISESLLFDQDWLTKAKLIRCSAPLPEGLENPILEKMLQTAPRPEPLKEDIVEDNAGGRGPPTLPILTKGASASMKEDGRRRKRTAPGDSEAEASKREKKSPTGGPTSGGAFAALSLRGGQSSSES